MRRMTLSNFTTFRGIVVLLVLLAVACLMPGFAAEKNKKRPPIYDPQLDVKAEIQKSLSVAREGNKHLLLMFGANWCPWCHRLHDLFQTDPMVKKILSDHYIVLLIDIGEEADKPLNRDLVDLYRVKGFGYPSLAVLSPKGRLICSQSTGVLEKGKAHDPHRVGNFLKAQAPAPPQE